MSTWRTDDGAVAVTTALVLMVLILLAAFLVDLGATRADARTDQLLADSAVMAGAAAEDSDGDGDRDAVDRCLTAARYFEANLRSGSGLDASSECATLPSSCQPGTTLPTTTPPIQVGQYTLEATYPVADSDPAMEVQQVDADHDGNPCQRLKVAVTRTRDYTFAPVAGAGTTGSSSNDAVARVRSDSSEGEYATLILLEQEECQELRTTGGATVVVQNEYAASGDLVAAGTIHLDSDGTQSCNGNRRIVDPGTSSNSAICAGVDGRDPDDVAAIVANGDCGTVLPDSITVMGSSNVAQSRFLSGGADDHELESDPSTTGERLTRSLVDHEYNCLQDPDTTDGTTTYPTDQSQYPSGSLVEPVDYCTDAHRGPHIDQLIAATFTGGAPPGFMTVGDGNKCEGVPAVVQSPFVYVDCPTMPSTSFESDIVVLEGGSKNKDGLDGGTVSVSPFSAGSSILVVKDGNLTMNSGNSFTFQDTFVYLHDGDMTVNGGEGMTWLAPDAEGYDPETGEPTGCEGLVAANDAPHPSCFQNLALWTNTSATHAMAGHGAMDVRGIFFGPNADFDLSGSGSAPDAPLAFENAQFFTRTLEISGGNGISMKPKEGVFIESPSLKAALIR